MDAETDFQHYVNAPEHALDLARAALLIARSEYPELDVEAYLGQLDRMAEAVRRQIAPGAGMEQTLGALNRHLFNELGFSGNVSNYYDPRNSFLNEVLDRRLGIPITLSLLYMELGHRLDLPLEGVSFPGHFLVKLSVDEGMVLLDPFAGGASLTEQDLVERIAGLVAGNRAPVRIDLGRLLASAGKRQILVRMLGNLRGIYLQRGDLDRALAVSDQIVQTLPDSPRERLERGRVLERLECPAAAVADYRACLSLTGTVDEDSLALGRRIAELQRLCPRRLQ